MDGQAEDAPLAGVRIVDLGGALAGPLAGMLLADQGAEVLRALRPGAPEHPVYAVLDRGKRRVPLDLKTEPGRQRLIALLGEADLLIENFAPGAMARLRLAPQTLKARFPDLITLSLPGFLPGDGMAGAKAHEGLIAALTGQFTDIHPARRRFGLDPVYTALPLASVYAAVHGATAAVLALRERRRGGGAARLEAPLAGAALSALSSVFMQVQTAPERYDAPRLSPLLKRAVLPLLRRLARRGGPARQARILGLARASYPAMMRSYRCADGRLLYLFAIDNAKIAQALLSELGLLERALGSGLVFADPYAVDRRDNLAESSSLARHWQTRLAGWIAEAIAAEPAERWLARLHAAGVPCAVQRATCEWLALPELAAAGLIAAVEDPALGAMRQPGPQVWLSDAPQAVARPGGRRPVETASAAWSGPTRDSDGARAPRAAQPPADGAAPAPLAGLRVVDLCSMVAGPVAGRTLAEYGAEVWRVEAPAPRHGPRMTCWYGLDGAQGKRSLLLDARRPAGRAALRALIRRADVLLTNHRAPAMARLGLDDAALEALNPGLIRLRIGAYNGPLGGPWRDRPGYDPVLQAASGIMSRYGDPGAPDLHAIASCVDALTGYSAAFGAALALLRRDADGRGRRVETALAAAATLVQIPFAFNHEGRRWTEPRGQAAKGAGPFERLYKARGGWLFLAAPGAAFGALPPSLAAQGADDRAREQALEARLARTPLREALARLNGAGLSAVAVEPVAALRRRYLGRDASASLRLIRRRVPGVGPVVSAPPTQIRWNGAPPAPPAPAEKPGAATRTTLRALGLDPDPLIAEGAAAEEISDAYLPS